MATVSMPPTSLPVTLENAIAFLIRPLLLTHPAMKLLKLKQALETNLTAAFALSWHTTDPSRGSGRRCMTLSPACMPPRAIYASCIAAGVQWFEWIAVLGNREFDLLVDPGRVAIRLGRRDSGSQTVTVWSAPSVQPRTRTAALNELKIQTQIRQQAEERAQVAAKTLEQELKEVDKVQDEELFQMIAEEVAAPSWMTPILDQFPMPVPSRSASPLSAISSYSRSSSSSRALSDYSFAETVDSFGSFTTVSSAASIASSAASSKPQQADSGRSSLSRRERARQARVFVDKSKREVVPYDGGKTTVLTGGVMLGAPKKVTSALTAAPKFVPRATGNTWRTRV